MKTLTRLLAGATLAVGLATSAAAAAPIAEVNVTIGAELQQKAEKLGQRELDYLSAQLRNEVQGEIDRAGGPSAEGARLDLVIVDARPNRPTFRQLTSTPGLSFESFSIGGAEIEGTLTFADGTSTPVRYRWYESDITQAQYRSTWHDATATFDRFARRIVRGDNLAQR